MANMDRKIKIILSGGGTMGSVSPMLAIRDKFIEQNIDSEFVWVGTENGPEREIVQAEGIEFNSIRSGKLRRYLSLKNIFDPFNVIIGVFQSFKLIKRFKPDVILSAGGFVSVPLILAGRLKGIKTFVHQQDLVPGLANKFMAKHASLITVSFKKSLDDFKNKEVRLIGNPVRPIVLQGDKSRGLETFGLSSDLPILVVMGGSLGATKINELIFESIPKLIDFCQIVHVVGSGNMVEWQDKEKFGANANRYHPFEYIHKQMPDLYAVADLVVCRAGLSTLSELAALKKPALVIPIPNNQQEVNAEYFAKQNAIIYEKQGEITSDDFVRYIRGLLESAGSRENLSRNISDVMMPDAADRYVKLILEILNK